MDLLDVERILESISGSSRQFLVNLEVFSEVDSTNKYMLEQPCPSPGRFQVAMAEHQTAGRGRLDRRWYSAPSGGICLSMSYTFASRPRDFSSLTLAIGASVADTLNGLGIRGIGLKWPNDIIIGDGKVGGILTEVQPAQAAGVTVVVGIGLNVDCQHAGEMEGICGSIGRVTDLASCCDRLPSRSFLSAALIDCLFNAMARFESDGFAPFIDSWQQFDWLRGQRIQVELTDELVPGVAQGIDDGGMLILETQSGTRRIVSGSVHFADKSGVHL